ncbi:MAG: hydroxyacid dehydrogenase [Clostridia bacterium]|nr:hydroxyacid dehydrogenase [Clostridia bacterium]
MKITVLDAASLGIDTPFERLRVLGAVRFFNETSPAQIAERIGDSDVIIINKIKITYEVLANAGKLKLICVFATGYDNIDIQAAKEHGVAVCNVPAYSTDSVALVTAATVLSLVTHLSEYRGFVCSGAYQAAGVPNMLSPVYHEIRGMKWGIVGFGNIGRAVARIAEALGAEVIVNKRSPISDYTCVDIDTLCKESDIITLHCPLTPETRSLINRERINNMKKSVVLVNEARGAVVDEEAVANAIINGEIAAFGCDVYSTEPFPANHPYTQIMNMPNVILTPHFAWGAYEARERCLGIIIQNIKSFFSNGTLNRVDL